MTDTQHRIDYRTLALAGVFQAAELVRAIANGMPVAETAREAVIAAITTHRAQEMSEIFPEPQLYRPGIHTARTTLAGDRDQADVLRYALQLIDLAKRLGKSRVVIERLSGGLDRLSEQPEPVVLAGLYQETISTLGKRIQVTGNPELLQQAPVAENIRALLLAGVRFAWLWQQLGGSRWQLIINRKLVLADLQALETAI